MHKIGLNWSVIHHLEYLFPLRACGFKLKHISTLLPFRYQKSLLFIAMYHRHMTWHILYHWPPVEVMLLLHVFSCTVKYLWTRTSKILAWIPSMPCQWLLHEALLATRWKDEWGSGWEREMKGSHLGSFSGFIEVTNPYLCTEAKIITSDATYSISG